MADLKSRKATLERSAKQWVSMNIDREVADKLKEFVNNDHPIRPTIKSAATVAIEEWIEREAKKIKR